MRKPNDSPYAGATRLANGDYLWPNGVVGRDPDKRHPCEVILVSGLPHNYSTQGRIVEFTRSEMAKPPHLRMPARARVICNSCRAEEAARDERQRTGRAARQAAAAASPPAPTAPPRSLDDVLAEADQLLGDDGSAAA
jgi:hypothetical protein